MRNAGLEEAQAGIKISGRNINNLRYEDDTTLMAESEEELKIKFPTSVGSQKKKESSRKTSAPVLFGYAKAFDCVDHNKLWKILQEMGIPDLLTCPLRNLYAVQEAAVRTGHGTTDWFQIEKGVHQG